MTAPWQPLHTEAAADGLSTLERLQEVVGGRLPQAPILEHLRMALVDVDEGRSTFHGRPAPEHRNFQGVIHGGYVTLLLDSAMGCAAYSTLGDDEQCATIGLELKFVREIAVGATLIAEGRVRHRGRRQVTADGEVVDERGRVLAHGVTTCLVFPLAPSPGDTVPTDRLTGRSCRWDDRRGSRDGVAGRAESGPEAG